MCFQGLIPGSKMDRTLDLPTATTLPTTIQLNSPLKFISFFLYSNRLRQTLLIRPSAFPSQNFSHNSCLKSQLNLQIGIQLLWQVLEWHYARLCFAVFLPPFLLLLLLLISSQILVLKVEHHLSDLCPTSSIDYIGEIANLNHFDGGFLLFDPC